MKKPIIVTFGSPPYALVRLADADGNLLAMMVEGATTDQITAHAREISLAVNNHEALVEALRTLCNLRSDCSCEISNETTSAFTSATELLAKIEEEKADG